MRLLNTSTLQLEVFTGVAVPPYTILSHRWEDEEVTLEDMKTGAAARMKGFAKIESSAHRARSDGCGHIWIDTCCIDKSSSAELSEAINSMFAWYQAAERCIVYLSDVSTLEDLAGSAWFTRGWTLQELIAPRAVVFLNCAWRVLGDKTTLRPQLHAITRVPDAVLLAGGNADADADHYLAAVPACRKLSWAAGRATTRPEDEAYCLLGLLGVAVPLLYGEGSARAFRRVQEAYVREHPDDESVLAWTVEPAEVDARASPYWPLLASSPRYFRRSGPYTVPRFKTWRKGAGGSGRAVDVTGGGVRAALTVQPLGKDAIRGQQDAEGLEGEAGGGGDSTQALFLAALNCSFVEDEADEFSSSFTVTLQRLSDFEDHYARVRPDAIIPVGEPSGTAWPAIGEASGGGGDRHSGMDAHLAEVFVRAQPRAGDPVAGFCARNDGAPLAFTFMAGSPRGPLATPGSIDVRFRGASDAAAEDTPRFCFLDVAAGEARLGTPGGFDVQHLTRRRVVGCLRVRLDASLDAPRRPIVPLATYEHPYLVLGLEPLPANPLGTPPGYVRPWYAFSDGWDAEALAALERASTRGQEGGGEMRKMHVAPGGTRVRVRFVPATYKLRTYYEVQVVAADK
ncbi:HET-domain-containing protein [Purpureocillium lavendulum]|uniref:HET-domain-containing protein n=1 Tax=Purpureocillium lavendulum TaxID=1247861 RepID=A0AB34FN89_9HYPO|nr:HET-domain-containing protein [Purpureocillium lavendulum]